jgi:hypothetical protein
MEAGVTSATAVRVEVAEAAALAAKAFADARIVLVCSLYGSTGSFFLQSLLDDHPDLYTFPSDIRRIPVFIEDFEAHTRDEHLRAVLDGNQRFFNTASERARTNSLRYLGDTRDGGLVIDRGRFTAYLTAMLEGVELTPRTFTLALVMAYNFTRDVMPSSNTFALYVHDLFRAVRLWRPQLGAVEIVAACRHPLNVYASACRRKRFDADDRGTLPAPYALTHVEGFTALPALLREAGADVSLVLIEELHANPRASLESLSARLGIPFAASMLESTIGGLKWWGSHQRVGTINGFDPGLHASVAVDAVGRRAERLVWRATERFQHHTGYARVRPAGEAARPRARWPKVALMFYRDLVGSAAALAAGAPSLRARVSIALRALRLALRYARVTLQERHAAERMGREDRATDYGRIAVLNPLSAATLRWPHDAEMRS